MIKKIATSSAYYGGGLSIQKKLFIVPSGAYQGRAIVVFPKSPTQIAYVWADPPYTSWSGQTIIITDSADYPHGAFMDAAANVYVAYTVEDSLDLAEKKLSFTGGLWSTGAKNVIYDNDSNYYPSFFKDEYDRLWVSWTRVSGGNSYVNNKRSTNDGVTWGSGPSDEGTTLTSGSSSCYSQLVYRPNHVYCIYTDGGGKLAYRRMSTSGSIFDDEVTLYSGSGLEANFSGASSDDLKLGIAFCDDTDLYYKEFDGAQWSGLVSVDSTPAVAPNLYFRQSVPYIVFGKQIGTNQHVPHYSFREGGSFTSPTPVSQEMSTFDSVLCYSPSAGVNFVDKSSEAADDTSADVYHDASGRLMLSSGDGVYIGQSEKFTALHVTLSTNGSGGAVAWYYWNGSDWKAFTPSSGAYHFDSSPATVRLWDDSPDVPSDWQTCVVNGSARYWVKAIATGDFSTGPIGSQITGALNVSYLITE